MLKSFYLLILSSTFIGWTTPSLNPNKEYSLLDLSELALKQNLAIQVSKLGLEMSKQQENQTGSLPNPTFKYSYFGENVETRVGPQEQKFSIEQKIPWPGKLKNQIKVAESRSKIADAEVHKQATHSLLKIRLLWADFQHLSITQSKTQATIKLYQTWLKQMQASFEVSQTPYYNLLKIQNQITILQSEFQKRSQDIETINTKLKAEINIKTDKLFLIKQKESFTKLALAHGEVDLNSAHQQNHAVMMARNDQAFWNSKEDLEESGLFPNFSIGLSYIQTGESSVSGMSDSGKDPWSVDLGLSIPLYFNQNISKQKEAQLGKSRAQHKMENALNKFKILKTELLTNLNKAQQDYDLYQNKILPNIEEAISQQNTMLSTNSTRFIDLLESYKMKLDYELKVENSIKKQFINKAKLLWLIGDTHPSFKFPFNTQMPIH